MDPPPYTAPLVAAPRLSISELHFQILANAKIIRPTAPIPEAADNRLALGVAKVVPLPRTPRHNPRPNPPSKTSDELPSAIPALVNAMHKSGPGVDHQATAPPSSSVGKHYAVLTDRTYLDRTVTYMHKGAEKDTVQEALEDMLEWTERVLHESFVKCGKKASSCDGCSVM